MSKKTVVIVFLLSIVLGVVALRLGLFPATSGSRSLSRPAGAGAEIFYGKGRCGICHTIGIVRGGKCPSLDGAGSRLMKAFIYEAMTAPSAYIRLDFSLAEPKEYSAKMPAVNVVPIGLTEEEMEQVILFIQEQK
ncbi:MAG: cytochrome c [Nitrospirota bacterium]